MLVQIQLAFNPMQNHKEIKSNVNKFYRIYGTCRILAQFSVILKMNMTENSFLKIV